MKMWLDYDQAVHGPSLKSINLMVTHEIGGIIRSTVHTVAPQFYQLPIIEQYKVVIGLGVMFPTYFSIFKILY